MNRMNKVNKAKANKANKSNKAVFLHQTGDESCLKWEDTPLAAAELGEEELDGVLKTLGLSFSDKIKQTT